MTKVEIHPEQVSLENDSESLPEPFNAVSYLGANEGFIQLEDLPGFDLDPERKLTYLQFMGEIGAALAEEPPKSEIWDGPLGAHGEDFQRASSANLTRGLYFSPLLSHKPKEVVTIGRYKPRLNAPGVRGIREGVAVSGEEFKAIARSPRDLIRHVHATTIRANEKRPPEERLDDETLENTAGRSMAYALLNKKAELLQLDNELKIERLALLAVNGLATTINPTEQAVGEMDWYRRVSALAIHGTVKVAASQLGYGTTVRWGINRAIVSATHRAEPEAMAASLRDYTKWAGYHIDAKRGKVYQSLSASLAEFRKISHYLRTKTT